jgi:hypothetical protein
LYKYVSLAVVFAAAVVALPAYAQSSQRSVVIGEMTSRPNALLVLNPPGSNQGFLLPQLSTSSRLAMHPSSPNEDGLIVFDTNQKEFYYWKSGQWVKGLGVTESITELPNQAGNSGKFLTTNGSTVSWATVTGTITPALQSYSIDPSDFFGAGNDKPDKNNGIIFEDNTTFITVQRKDDGSLLIAPFHLPDGAAIQQILVYYMDREAQNLSVTVTRKTFTGGNDSITNTWTSSGSSSSIQTQTITPIAGKDVIDNSLYSYRVMIDLNPSGDANDDAAATHRVYGVQIKYIK